MPFDLFSIIPLPSNVPSNIASSLPSELPSELPTSVPSGLPTSVPSGLPTSIPSGVPNSIPSGLPSELPSSVPSELPSSVPSELPSSVPSSVPSSIPSGFLDSLPFNIPFGQSSGGQSLGGQSSGGQSSGGQSSGGQQQSSGGQQQSKNKSTILTLESLMKQYDTLLMQYNQVQSDYMDFLQNLSLSGNNASKLTSLINSTFWGAGGLLSSRVSSIEQCSALCSKTPGCSGATYNVTLNNDNKDNCWIITGDGEVIPGTSEQYAIIPEIKKYLQLLQSLNLQLLYVNNEIIVIFKTNEINFSIQDKERFIKYNLLKENYRKLEEERINIAKKIMDQQTIEGKKTQTELIVTKNYYNYLVLLFIVLLCFLILSKTIINSFNQNDPSSNNNFGSVILMFVFSFIIILSITYFYKTFM